MLAIIKKAKELWGWYSFAVGVGAIAVSGFAVAAGGAVWLVNLGLPLPLVMMAAYCTLVGAVYLALAPLVYRVLVRSSAAAAPSEKRPLVKVRPTPNYAAVRHMHEFELGQASRLWCDIDQNSGSTPASEAWLQGLQSAVKRGELKIVPSSFGRGSEAYERQNPDFSTVVTRDELLKFATLHPPIPRFLSDR